MNNTCKNILSIHKTGITNRAIARELHIHHNTVKYWLDKNNLKPNGAISVHLIIVDGFATCSKCGARKTEDNFLLNRRGTKYPYKLSYCNECRKKQLYNYMNRDIKVFLSDRYNRLLLRANKHKIPITITKEDFISIYYKQNGKCFYTDINMVCKVGDGSNRYSMSVDKIIPELGYTKDNTVLCINKANTIKNDCTLEEMSLWMPNWYKRIIDKEVTNGNF